MFLVSFKFKSRAFVFEILEGKPGGGGFGGVQSVGGETDGGVWTEIVVGELGAGHLFGFKIQMV